MTALWLVLAAATAGAQGDEFHSNSQTSCAEARRRAAEQQAAAAAEIARARDAVQAQYVAERRACGSTDERCLTAASRRDDERRKQIGLRELADQARFQKAQIDVELECAAPRLNANGPCGPAALAEDLLHRRAAAEIAKERVDAFRDVSQARMRCESNDEACTAAANAQHVARSNEIAAEERRESARHEQAERSLRAGQCAPGTNGGGLPLPADLRQQLMKSAAEMDRLAADTQKYALAGTNRFFKCLTEAVGADLRFLAQPAYVPAAQLAKALHQGTWSYLTGNAYENNRKLFDGALASLRQFKDDPACWFGKEAPGAAVAAVTRLGTAVAEASAAQRAANAAVRTANAAAARRVAYGSSPGGLPRGRSVNPHNPACAPHMCFPSAIAKDLEWETGDPLWAEAFAGNFEIQIIDGVPTKVFNLTTEFTIETMLGSLYGSKKLQGPALGAARLADQMAGRAAEMTRAEMEAEMRAAGAGSRGLLFLRSKLGEGHVVNVRNNGGRLEFPDASNSNMDATFLVENAAEIKLFRTN